MESNDCSCEGQEGLSAYTVLYLISSTVETVLGVSLNAFVVIARCLNLSRRRPLKSIDKILMALGISKIFYSCMLATKIFLSAAFPCASEDTHLYQTSRALVWFLTCTNFCFSACLCIFYCLKIANFQNFIFVYLKTIISKLVPCLLLLSVPISAVNTFPFFINNIYDITCAMDSSSPGNNTLKGLTLKTNVFNLVILCGVGFSVIFLVLITSTFLLLYSLRRHTQRMQNGAASSSMAAHFRAVRMILSLLTIDTTSFVTLMLLLSNIFPDQDPINQFCVFIINLMPTMQSNILIWGNAGLRKEFVRFMHWVKLTCWKCSK